MTFSEDVRSDSLSVTRTGSVANTISNDLSDGVGTLGMFVCYADQGNNDDNCMLYFVKADDSSYELKKYKNKLDGDFARPGVGSRLAVMNVGSSDYPDVVAACYGTYIEKDPRKTNFQGCKTINAVASCITGDGNSNWVVILIVVLIVLVIIGCIGACIWACCRHGGCCNQHHEGDGHAQAKPPTTANPIHASAAPTMGHIVDMNYTTKDNVQQA